MGLLLLTSLFALIGSVLSAPLTSDSIFTVRQPALTGPLANSMYIPSIIEEWQECKSSPCNGTARILQQWSLPTVSRPGAPACTNLQGEGKLQFGAPDLTNVWYMCRDIPANNNVTYRPAPVTVGRIKEDGTWAVQQTGNFFPAGTTLVQIMGKTDPASGSVTDLYMLGGSLGRNGLNFAQIQSQTGLSNFSIAANLFEITLLENNFNLLAQPPINGGSSTGQLPNTYMVSFDAYGNITYTNTGWRITSGLTISETPTVAWFIADAPRPTLVRLDLETGINQTFKLPGSTAMGGVAAAPWVLHSSQYHSDGNFYLYLGNGTHVVEFNPFGVSIAYDPPFKTVITAPAGWKYTSVHARRLAIPYPSPTPSPTPTATTTPSNTPTSSPSFSNTPSPSYSNTPSPSYSNTPTSSPSYSNTPTSSPSYSNTPSPSYSNTPTPTGTPSPSYTSTPVQTVTATPSPAQQTNNTGDINAIAPGAEATTPTTSLETGHYAAIAIAGVAVLGLAFSVYRTQKVQNYLTGTFGLRSRNVPSGTLRKRSVMTTDAILEINHNPQLILTASEQRMEHLRRQYAGHSNGGRKQQNRVKKEFTPVTSVEY